LFATIFVFINIKSLQEELHGENLLRDGSSDSKFIYNEKGELLDFDLTPGNVADNNHGLLKRILKKIKGVCFGDKGYATTLWKEFYENGLKIITKTKGKTDDSSGTVYVAQTSYNRECE